MRHYYYCRVCGDVVYNTDDDENFKFYCYGQEAEQELAKEGIDSNTLTTIDCGCND